MFEDARKQGYVRVRVDGEIMIFGRIQAGKTKSTTLDRC
ncbi:MAG: hypothetical protein ACLSF2_05940 [Butyricicoccus sp.]